MRGNGKLIGFLIGIIFVLATIVVAYVYKDDIVGCLKKLKNKYSKKGLSIIYDDSNIKSIIEKSEYEDFGARKIDKIIRDEIENYIIEEYLNGKTIINITSINKLVLN